MVNATSSKVSYTTHQALRQKLQAIVVAYDNCREQGADYSAVQINLSEFEPIARLALAYLTAEWWADNA